jgi:hypothetical protein
MSLTSNCIVPFSLTKRNDLGNAYANINLIASTNAKYVPQIINNNSSINFNQYTKLLSIAWLTSNTLTFLKNGTFRIQFFINYTALVGTLKIALYVNGNPITGTFDTTITEGQINGEFTVKLLTSDKIQLINIGDSFTITPVQINQILANITVTEIN